MSHDLLKEIVDLREALKGYLDEIKVLTFDNVTLRAEVKSLKSKLAIVALTVKEEEPQ